MIVGDVKGVRNGAHVFWLDGREMGLVRNWKNLGWYLMITGAVCFVAGGWEEGVVGRELLDDDVAIVYKINSEVWL